MEQSDKAPSADTQAWDQSYAPRADGRLRWPLWYELDCADMAECVRASQLPHARIRRIVDVDAGYGARDLSLRSNTLVFRCVKHKQHSSKWM
jgi:hypothetical protein